MGNLKHLSLVLYHIHGSIHTIGHQIYLSVFFRFSRKLTSTVSCGWEFNLNLHSLSLQEHFYNNTDETENAQN